jgi:signal transduction histidine kinase
MLDVVKIDSSAMEISPEPVAVGLLIRNVAGNYKNALRHREISLVIDDLSHLPIVEVDTSSMEKVFYQLLSNAIKYTPNHGIIHVSGSLIPTHAPGHDHATAHDHDHTPPGWVEVIVEDNGIGIDPDQQELIFTKFYQTGKVALHSTSRTQFKGGGPGLGLAIVRGIIDAHGGRVWVESAGHDETNLPGSRFHLVIPIRPQKNLAASKPGMAVDFPTNSAYT